MRLRRTLALACLLWMHSVVHAELITGRLLVRPVPVDPLMDAFFLNCEIDLRGADDSDDVASLMAFVCPTPPSQTPTLELSGRAVADKLAMASGQPAQDPLMQFSFNDEEISAQVRQTFGKPRRESVLGESPSKTEPAVAGRDVTRLPSPAFLGATLILTSLVVWGQFSRRRMRP